MEKQTSQAKQKSMKRRSLTGVVISDARDKTITVRFVRRFKHPLYGKYIKKTSKLHVHDPKNEAAIGDEVSIESSRPISKTKSFRIVEVKKKAGA